MVMANVKLGFADYFPAGTTDVYVVKNNYFSADYYFTCVEQYLSLAIFTHREYLVSYSGPKQKRDQSSKLTTLN